jgi:hypothetical protein
MKKSNSKSFFLDHSENQLAVALVIVILSAIVNAILTYLVSNFSYSIISFLLTITQWLILSILIWVLEFMIVKKKSQIKLNLKLGLILAGKLSLFGLMVSVLTICGMFSLTINLILTGLIVILILIVGIIQIVTIYKNLNKIFDQKSRAIIGTILIIIIYSIVNIYLVKFIF